MENGAHCKRHDGRAQSGDVSRCGRDHPLTLQRLSEAIRLYQGCQLVVTSLADNLKINDHPKFVGRVGYI